MRMQSTGVRKLHNDIQRDEISCWGNIRTSKQRQMGEDVLHTAQRLDQNAEYWRKKAAQ